MIAASRADLEKHGVPRRPEDMARHNCLTLTGIADQAKWPLRGPDGVRLVARGKPESDVPGRDAHTRPSGI